MQDRFKRRAALQVAFPERFLVRQQDEVSTPVMQVGQRPPRGFGMRRRGRVCAEKVRKVLLASGGWVEWHRCIPPHVRVSASLVPPRQGYQRTRTRCSINESAFEGGTFHPSGRCLPSLYTTHQNAVRYQISTAADHAPAILVSSICPLL